MLQTAARRQLRAAGWLFASLAAAPLRLCSPLIMGDQLVSKKSAFPNPVTAGAPLPSWPMGRAAVMTAAARLSGPRMGPRPPKSLGDRSLKTAIMKDYAQRLDEFYDCPEVSVTEHDFEPGESAGCVPTSFVIFRFKHVPAEGEKAPVASLGYHPRFARLGDPGRPPGHRALIGKEGAALPTRVILWSRDTLMARVKLVRAQGLAMNFPYLHLGFRCYLKRLGRHPVDLDLVPRLTRKAGMIARGTSAAPRRGSW